MKSGAMNGTGGEGKTVAQGFRRDASAPASPMVPGSANGAGVRPAPRAFTAFDRRLGASLSWPAWKRTRSARARPARGGTALGLRRVARQSERRGRQGRNQQQDEGALHGASSLNECGIRPAGGGPPAARSEEVV